MDPSGIEPEPQDCQPRVLPLDHGPEHIDEIILNNYLRIYVRVIKNYRKNYLKTLTK